MYKLMVRLANLNLTGKLSWGPTSVAGGGQADIYRSRLEDGREVAVKIFRFDMREKMRYTKVHRAILTLCNVMKNKFCRRSLEN